MALSTTPNDFGLGLTGQVSVLERSTLHVDEGKLTQTSMKEKVSKLDKGLGKMAKNQGLPSHLQKKDSKGENTLTMHEHHKKKNHCRVTKA